MKRLLPLFCLACESPGHELASWVEVPVSDSGQTDLEWKDGTWWTDWDLSLERILYEDEDEFKGWEVQLWTSEDGQTYTEHPDSPLAYDLSSLGLFQEDGALVISGVLTHSPDNDPRTLVALTTTDLEHWGVRSWFVDWEDGKSEDAHDALVDPQFTRDGNGDLGVWFYGFSGAGKGDPMDIPGPHEMCRAELRDATLFTEVECPVAVENAADPSPLWDGSRWLVPMTLRAKDQPFSEQVLIHTVVDDERSQTVTTLDDAAVPYLRIGQNHSLDLWYQSWNDRGHPRPSRVQSQDGGKTWSEPEYPLGKNGECTSPLYTQREGLHILVCADDQGGYHTNKW